VVGATVVVGNTVVVGATVVVGNTVVVGATVVVGNTVVVGATVAPSTWVSSRPQPATSAPRTAKVPAPTSTGRRRLTT
jgi:tetrahydrodipicolinate N-succinyltransferase